MSEKTQTEKSEPKKIKTNKFKKLKIGLAVLAILALVGGAYLYQQDRQAQLQRAELQAQREELINFWTEQGLSQEEIDEKLKEQASADRLNQEPSVFQSIFRTVRHTTGTAPEPGTGPGGGIGDGTGPGAR